MTQALREMLGLRAMLVFAALVASVCAIGCGPEGAGTIHVNSPRAKKDAMKTGAGVAPAAAPTSVPSPKTQKSASASTGKNRTSNRR
jgi:hypothetical protein